ncbi:MAG TPA: penicillin acylase family protein [Acetobacteraceae bacterium]
MRTFLRRTAKLLAVIGTLVLLLAAVCAGTLWLTLPGGSQEARLPGLLAPVEIGFDADGIPRIHAGSATDAAAALGFVHARDRMFQMELMRRAASGRLSEIAGPAALPIDRMMRTLGLRQSAITDMATLPADTRAMLDAYARGVNAWIDERGRLAAPEFLLLGRPEHWQAVDSLLWAKTMGLWLSGNWHTELSRLALAGHVPQRLIDELWPPEGGGQPDAALPAKARFAQAAERLIAVLPRFPAAFTLPQSASNEWAVDGRHTATGAPLLAGDPHLAFGFPGVWYLARIETPGHVLVGATAPGVPFLVLGHNGHIAWTFTSTEADVQDVFIETPAGNGKYQTPDGPRPFEVREERIKVRGQADVMLTVRETRHGPVVSDLPGVGDSTNSRPILAVEMANLQPGDTAAAGLFALNQAQTVAQAGQAAAMITSPVQNLLVADHETIGQFVTGRVPIRKQGDGFAPVTGDGSHDWVGWASGEQLPHNVSPASGRLVNANERIAPPDFPVFLGRSWFGDWRAVRIRELLDQSDRHTADGFARMQLDVRSTFARQVLPALLAVPASPGAASRAQALLRGWDGSMTMDAPQPLIFNAWIEQFYKAVLDRATIAPRYGGPVPDFVAFVLSADGAHWCGGDCAPMLTAALDAAMAELTERFGEDPTAWRWGAAHQAIFAHPMLRGVPILGSLTTLMIPTPGDGTTVDQGGVNALLQSVHGPSYRGVYDLADLDRSLFIVVPGQSGNPLSHHARDFLTRWRDGATITLGPIAASTKATIRLTP